MEHHNNIVEFINNLPKDVKNEITNIYRTGIITENAINIGNIEHFLIASRNSNPLKVVCEENLLRTLSSKNCWNVLTIAERHDLVTLRSAAINLIESGFFKDFDKCQPSPIRVEKCSTHVVTDADRDDGYCRFTALFTINQTKRLLQVIVLDSGQHVRCYRNLKYSKNITNDFQICCLHDDVKDTTFVFWSCGKAVFRYDSFMNRSKKCKPLKYRRCNFCMVGHGNQCYVIGGVYKGQYISNIEQYDLKRKTWKKVANLPVNVKSMNMSCAVMQNLIYILTLFNQNQTTSDLGIAICIFNPEFETVQVVSKIPVLYEQIKTCALGPNIYIASCDGRFWRYNTQDKSIVMLQEQIVKCRDTAMYSDGNSIFLSGGVNQFGNLNDTIRQFCPVSSCWHMHQNKLPDCMPVYGTCEIKVPKGSNSKAEFVPFYENNYVEIR